MLLPVPFFHLCRYKGDLRICHGWTAFSPRFESLVGMTVLRISGQFPRESSRLVDNCHIKINSACLGC